MSPCPQSHLPAPPAAEEEANASAQPEVRCHSSLFPLASRREPIAAFFSEGAEAKLRGQPAERAPCWHQGPLPTPSTQTGGKGCTPLPGGFTRSRTDALHLSLPPYFMCACRQTPQMRCHGLDHSRGSLQGEISHFPLQPKGSTCRRTPAKGAFCPGGKNPGAPSQQPGPSGHSPS